MQDQAIRKRPLSEYLFYAGLGVLTLWLILKVTGVIQTPVWLEYGVPIGSGILAAFNLLRTLMKEMSAVRSDVARVDSKVTHIDRDVERVKDELSELREDVTGLKVDVGALKTDLSAVKRVLEI